MSVLEDLAKLKQEVSRAQTLRARADANLGLVRRQLEEVDGKLKGLGIDPEHAEQELAAMEAQLAASVADLRAKVAEETAAYEDILRQTEGVLR